MVGDGMSELLNHLVAMYLSSLHHTSIGKKVCYIVRRRMQHIDPNATYHLLGNVHLLPLGILPQIKCVYYRDYSTLFNNKTFYVINFNKNKKFYLINLINEGDLFSIFEAIDNNDNSCVIKMPKPALPSSFMDHAKNILNNEYKILYTIKQKYNAIRYVPDIRVLGENSSFIVYNKRYYLTLYDLINIIKSNLSLFNKDQLNSIKTWLIDSIKRITDQLLEHGIVNLDLKFDNFLIDNVGNGYMLLLSDFSKYAEYLYLNRKFKTNNIYYNKCLNEIGNHNIIDLENCARNKLIEDIDSIFNKFAGNRR